MLCRETNQNMTPTLIAPLRKRNKESGEVYTRTKEITAKLAEINALTHEQLSTRCIVEDPKSANYLPSECLLYLVRERRSGPFDEYSETLFKALIGRVSRGLPQAESFDGTSERMTDCNVREEGRHRFLTMLMKDRQEYFEGLDIYEVRFAMALKKLRLDAQRKVYPKDNPLESIEIDHETGEIAPEVEQASGTFNPFDSAATANFDYLLRLDKAIDGLPELQKTIVVMIRNEFPIESKEPEVVNISKTLKKTPKTIRTHRDHAYATLRAALMKGEKV